MPCNHIACRACLDMWFDQNAAEMGNLSCPMCRTSVGCPPPEEYSKLLAEADAKAEAAAAKKVAAAAAARPAVPKEKPVVAPENAPVAVQINKVRKKDRKAAAGDASAAGAHSALPTAARPTALVGVISKHFSKVRTRHPRMARSLVRLRAAALVGLVSACNQLCTDCGCGEWADVRHRAIQGLGDARRGASVASAAFQLRSAATHQATPRGS